MRTLYRVSLPYATFGIIVIAGWVRDAAPIGSWMTGKSLNWAKGWAESKGGKVEEVQQ